MFKILKTINDSSTAKQLNELRKIQIKRVTNYEDIIFLKRCLRKEIFPKFMKIEANVINQRSIKAVNAGKKFWLRSEIRWKYAKLNSLNLQHYQLYKKVSQVEWKYERFWFDEMRRMHEISVATRLKKKEKLKKKFNELLYEQREKLNEDLDNEVKSFDYVINQSTEVFTRKEMELLNKGLKFIAKPSRPPIDEIVIGIESSIQFESDDVKTTVREACKKVFKKCAIKKPNPTESTEALKLLKQRSVFYMKPDKGNGIVIMDKSDYEERVETLLLEGPYIRYSNGRMINDNPINKMQQEVKNLLKDLVEKNDLNKFKANSLVVSNPSVPMLYALPKTHKPGKKMRPIISSCNSPTSKLSKWIANELQKLDFKREFEVKNTEEVVNKLKNVKIEDDEILVSFDVESLFPSIPVEKALSSFKYHLERKIISKDSKQTLYKSTVMCLDQNIFQFRGKYYKQESGLAIGNALSPCMASFFMTHFENQIKNRCWFPRIYIRYVDDIFAIVKKEKLESTLEKLNSLFPTIKFTVEKEENGSIPFLDLLISRFEGGLKFSIYRKPTSNQQYIPSDSNHCRSHKFAAFNSMIHRLIKVPMDEEDYRNELNYITNTAQMNGYKKQEILNLLNKHERKEHLRDVTTLENEKDEARRICVPYFPNITNRLQNEMKKIGFKLVYQNDRKLSDILGNMKDKRMDLEKSGIYSISCSNCDALYIGQTRRAIKTRYNEHCADCRKEATQDKPMPFHAISNHHKFQDVKLLKEVRNPLQLDAYESLYLHKHRNENLVNIQNYGNINSRLFKIAGNLKDSLNHLT